MCLLILSTWKWREGSKTDVPNHKNTDVIAIFCGVRSVEDLELSGGTSYPNQLHKNWQENRFQPDTVKQQFPRNSNPRFHQHHWHECQPARLACRSGNLLWLRQLTHTVIVHYSYLDHLSRSTCETTSTNIRLSMLGIATSENVRTTAPAEWASRIAEQERRGEEEKRRWEGRGDVTVQPREIFS